MREGDCVLALEEGAVDDAEAGNAVGQSPSTARFAIP